MYFCTRKSGLHLRSTWQRRNGMATARVRGPLILLQSESASSGRRKIASYNNCNVFKFDPNFHFYFNNILFNFYDGSFFGSKNICFIVRPLLVIENLKQKKTNQIIYASLCIHRIRLLIMCPELYNNIVDYTAYSIAVRFQANQVKSWHCCC